MIVHYGLPERLHSNEGPDFESKTIRELCEEAENNSEQLRTILYYSSGNPVECLN